MFRELLRTPTLQEERSLTYQLSRTKLAFQLSPGSEPPYSCSGHSQPS